MLRYHLKAKASEITRFRLLVRGMTRQGEVYKMLKEELGAMGYWKAAPRGKPSINNLNGKKGNYDY